MFGSHRDSASGRDSSDRRRAPRLRSAALRGLENALRPRFEGLESRQLLTAYSDLASDISGLLPGQDTGSHTFTDVSIGQFLTSASVTVTFESDVQDGQGGWTGTVEVAAQGTTLNVGGATSGLTIAVQDPNGGDGLAGKYTLSGSAGGTGAFSLTASTVTATLPGVFGATASGISVDYDEQGPSDQQIASIASLTGTITPFDDMSAMLNTLTIDANGFSLFGATAMVPSVTFGGVLTAETPTLSVSNFSDYGGAPTGTIGLSAGLVSLFPGNSAFTATVDGFSGTYTFGTGATAINATDVKVDLGGVVDAEVDSPSFQYDPTADSFSFSASDVSMTSRIFGGVTATAQDITVNSGGLSISQATLAPTNSNATIDLGGVLELQGVSVDLSGFDYQVDPPAGTPSISGTVGITIGSSSLLGGSLPFTSSLSTLSATYAIATEALTVQADEADIFVGSTLTVEAVGPSFAVAPDPSGSGDDVTVTIKKATATLNELGGLTGTIGGLTISNDGFRVTGSATLSSAGDYSLAGFTVDRPSVSLSNFGYSKSGGGFTAGSLTVSASEIDLAAGPLTATASGNPTATIGLSGDVGAFSFTAGTVTVGASGLFGGTADSVTFGYDPAGGSNQQLAKIGSFDATLTPFAGAGVELDNLDIYEDGFSIGQGHVTADSLTFGGVLTADSPTLTFASFADYGGAPTGTIGLSAGSVSLFPGNSAFTATVDGFSATYTFGTNATVIQATEVDVALGSVLTGKATGLTISYVPDSFSLSATSVDLTSSLFSGVEVKATGLTANASGFSIADAKLTQTSPDATVDVGGVLELGGLSLDLQNFEYYTDPAPGQASITGTVTVDARSIGLFGGSLPFSTSVLGFNGYYDIASGDLSVGATSATITAGSALTVVAAGPKFAIAKDPTTGGDDVTVTIKQANATLSELGGLNGTITGLTITNDGFSIGSGTLSSTSGSYKVGSFVTVVGPSVGLGGFGYSKSEKGGAAFTASSLTVGASTITLALGSVTATASGASASISFAPSTLGHFTFTASSLSATLGGGLTLTANGSQTVPLSFDSSPTSGSYVAQFGSATASLALDSSLTLTGTATDFAIGAGGTFVAEPGFGVGFTTTGDQVDWPSWLPIQNVAVALSWPNFSSAPADFAIELSATVSKTVDGLTIAGSVQDAVIDTKLLSEGQFPVTSIGGFGVSVGGSLFGFTAEGQFFLGTLQTDANYNPITVPPGQEPAHNFLYGGLDVGVDFDNLGGFDFRIALSQLGPLDVFISSDIPILLDPETGLALTNIHGGIDFGATLPSITRAQDLLNNPALTPPGQQTLAEWESQVAGEVATQVKANPTGSFDPSSLASSGLVFDAGATLYDEYATTNAFEFDGDILFDTTGKIEATGKLTLGDTLKVNGGLYLDLSEIGSGTGTILAYAQVPDPSGSSTPLVAVYGGITFTFGNSAPSGLAGDSTLDGTDAYASANSGVVPTGGPFEVDLYAERTDQGLANPEDVINQGGPSGLEIGFNPSGELFATLGNATVTDPTASDESWHDWSVTFDGATLSIKMDGQVVASGPATATAPASTLLIGQSSAQTPTYFEGLLGETKAWNDSGSTPVLLADWTFAQDTNGVVADTSGNGHGATVHGNWTFGPLLEQAPQGPSSPLGNSLTLNGTTDYASASPVVPVGSSFTVEFWARRADQNRLEYIVSQGAGLAIGFDANNNFFVTAGSMTLKYATTDMLWHHWAVSFNSTTGTWAIDLDGNKVASKTGPGYSGTAPAFLIGRSGSTYFDGSITDVRAWSAARPDANAAGESQVKADMLGDNVLGYGGTPLPAGDVLETGLLASWSFAGATTSVVDASGNDNTAAIFGSLTFGPTDIDPPTAEFTTERQFTIVFNAEADLTLPHIPSAVQIFGNATLTVDLGTPSSPPEISLALDGTADIASVGNALGVAGYVHVDLGSSPDAYGALVVDTAQLSTRQQAGIDISGDAILEFNTTSSSQQITLNVPMLSSTAVPPPTTPTALTLAPTSALLIIQGSAEFQKGAGGQQWFEANGTFVAAFNDTNGPELDLYIDGEVTIGPASSPFLTVMAVGLVDISGAGLAASITATVSASTPSSPSELSSLGVDLSGTLTFIVNTTDQTIVYTPPAVPGSSYSQGGTTTTTRSSAAGATVTIPSAPPGQTTPQPYLELSLTNATVEIASFTLTGAFQLIVSPDELSIGLDANLAVAAGSTTLVDFGVAGGLLLEKDPTNTNPNAPWGLVVAADLTLGGTPSIGSGISFNANFLFEVNTFSESQNFPDPEDTQPAIPADTAEVEGNGDLILGSFAIAGGFDFIYSSGNVEIAAQGMIGLGELGDAKIKGELTYNTNPTNPAADGFYGVIDATFTAGSSSTFLLAGSFELAFNATNSMESPTGYFDYNGTETVTLDPDTFSVFASGTLVVDKIIDLSGSFGLTINSSGVDVEIVAQLTSFFGGPSLNLAADAEVFGDDSQGSGGLVIYASLSASSGGGSFSQSFGGGLVSISGSATLLINTTDTTRSVTVAGVQESVEPETYQVSLTNVDLDFCGLKAGGSITIGVVDGEFEMDIPESDPLSVDFFGLGSLGFYGDIIAGPSIEFDLNASVSVYLSCAIGDLYGGLGISISNSGFSASFYGGCDVDIFGHKYTLASVSGSMTIASDYFDVQATVDVIGFTKTLEVKIGEGKVTPPQLPPGISYYTAPATAQEGEAVTLTAVGADSSGNQVSSTGYTWSVTYNGQDFASGDESNAGGSDQFTLGAPGDYVVTVSAAGYSRSSTILVLPVAPTVTSINVVESTGTEALPPTLADSDQSPITLNASLTNPDTVDGNNPLTYKWTVTEDGGAFALPPGANNKPQFSFIPGKLNPKTGSDTYTITLVVSDNFGDSVTTGVTTIVYNPNNLVLSDPNGSDPKTVMGSLAYVLNLISTEPSGGTITVNVYSSLAHTTLDTSQVTSTPDGNAAIAFDQSGAAGITITLNASSAPGFALSAAKSPTATRLFYVGSGYTLYLHDLNLTGGSAQGESIPGKSTPGTPGFAGGGAIDAEGTARVYVENSAIYGNSAFKTIGDGYTTGSEGGAVYVGGPNAYFESEQSTYSGNTAKTGGDETAGLGGAIYSQGLLVLYDDTISGNSAGAGSTKPAGAGGVEQASSSSTPIPFIVNSIIYGNTGSSDLQFDGPTPPTQTVVASNDDIGTVVNAPSPFGTDMSSKNPLLGPLADHGDGVLTYSLMPHSAAINLGSAAALSFFGISVLDGRGFPQEDAYHPSGEVDAGAFETQPYLVTTNADSGPGSLRQALAEDDNDAPILLSSSLGGQIIALNTSLVVANDVAIAWSGPGLLGIEPSGTYSGGSFIDVKAGVTATISGLTISGGSSGEGGAIYNNGNLTLADDVFSDDDALSQGGAIYNNAATLSISGCYFDEDQVNPAGGPDDYGVTAYGGAIANSVSSTLTIVDSAFSNDQANSSTGAVGGAISNYGTLSATDVTFSGCGIDGNQSGGLGGELYNYAEATLIGCTFADGSLSDADPTGNKANPGPSAIGLGEEIDNSTIGTIALINTIVAGGSSPLAGGVDLANSGKLTGEDDVVPTSSGTVTGLTDLIVADPKLANLADNGGPTPTVAIFAGSSAIGAGDPTQLGGQSVDGRGYPRTVGGPVDIGAYERQVYTVTNTNDSGPGSLRQAVSDDTTGDEPVVFAPALDGQDIRLLSPISISHPVTIEGPGAGELAVDGQAPGGIANNQIFLVVTSGAVSIAGLTLQNGAGTQRGGAIENAGQLTLSGVIFSDDHVAYSGVGGMAEGGAIYDAPNSSLTVTDGTFEGNYVTSLSPLLGDNEHGPAAASGGGAIYNDVGATLSLSNDTFSGSEALVSSIYYPSSKPASGGAIDNAGTATLVNVTIANGELFSAQNQGSGIYNAAGGSLTIENTIVYDDQTGVADLFNAGTAGAVVGDHDLIDNVSGPGNLAGLSISGAGPNLGPLQDNGGPTPTMIPGANSPAIGQGNVAYATTEDQRGFSRVAGTMIDIGAVETSTPLLVTTTADYAPGGTVVVGSLRAALAELQSGSYGPSIAFAPGLAGATITLDAPLVISGSISINGPGAPGLVISGAGLYQVFTVQSSGSLTLEDLSVEDGYAAQGGGIANAGSITLLDVTLADDVATGNGGALYNSGTAVVTNATISGNRASYGGGVANAGGMITLTSDTIVGNSATSGGGVDAIGGTVAIRDSIVSGDTDAQGGFDVLGAIQSRGFNLYGTLSPASSTNPNPNDIVNTSPNLAPLAFNGGPTETMALLPGSKAIGAAAEGGTLSTDERGQLRIVNGSVDIGAYQTQDSLAVASTPAVYGGTVNLAATLLFDGQPLANQSISFDLNGILVGSEETNAQGVATLLGVPLGRYPAGSLLRGIEAIFNASPGGVDNSATSAAAMTIAKAPLTITANNATKVYGQANPILSGTVVGLLNGDSATFIYKTKATQSSDVTSQPYAIVPVVEASPSFDLDYQITEVDGGLTIAPAGQTITWADPAPIVYGTPLGGSQLDAVVTVPGTAAAGTVTYSVPAGTVLHVGQVTDLSVSVAATTDYTAATAEVPFAVDPAPLTIAAADETILAGSNLPTLSANYLGFVNGDGPSSLASPASLATTVSTLSAPGTYPITASGAASTDYAITDVPGTLTVVPRAILLGIAPVAPAITSALDSVEVTFSQPIDPTTFSASDVILSLDGSPVALVGTPTITPVGTGSATYMIAGLAASDVAEGSYGLTIGTAGLTGPDGFAATGSALTGWLVDLTAPTSSVVPLPPVATSYTFPVTASGTDLLSSDGLPGSGVAAYTLYASDDGGPFVAFATVPASSPTANFTGQAGHTYSFRSLSQDAAGNVETKPISIEAATYVPDLNPPTTSISSASVAPSTGLITLDLLGEAGGISGLASFDLTVRVDGGPSQTVAVVPAGSPDANGAYHAPATYQAAEDGINHVYTFSVVGVSGEGVAEAPHSGPDATVNGTFAPQAPAVTAFGVDHGAVGRSFVRYVDLTLNEPDAAMARLIASGGVRLVQHNLDGSGGSILTVPASDLSVVDHAIEFDFGAEGIGSLLGATTADSTVGNGYYEVDLDLDGSGQFPTRDFFYRLFGDVAGDRSVDANDLNLINAAVGVPTPLLTVDLDGTGTVTAAAKTLARKSQLAGLALGAGLHLDA